MATLKHLAAQKNIELEVDSCGIGWVHLGQSSDPRMFETFKKKGVLIDHRAQQFQDELFEIYDLILTVDDEISEQLKLRGPQYKDKIKLVTDFSKKYKGKPIPDPYYLSSSGFDEVAEMIFDCCEEILKSLYHS